MNSRFKPDRDADVLSRFVGTEAPESFDPEPFDASEQRFAATLEGTNLATESRFVVEAGESDAGILRAESAAEMGEHAEQPTDVSDASVPARTIPSDLILQQDSGSWRSEVAAKVNRYKARKPRPPRYPSLQLKFEPRETWKDSNRNEISETSSSLDYSTHNRDSLAVQSSAAIPERPVHEESYSIVPSPHQLEIGARILEFPRSLVLPSHLDELAEPVADKPRILDVPEVAPPAPALGGISIEPVEQVADEKRPGIDVPLQSAGMSRRVCAASIDALLVAIAAGLFGYVFFRITNVVPPIREAAETGILLTALFWGAYQYLLLVHSGTTPGLRLAKLQLQRFDGSSVPVRARRWRVMASFLSALSLGIGYVWCFLDEDQLCWHDRITHTHMAPRNNDLPK